MSSSSSLSLTSSAVMEPFKQNIFNNCPGGLCRWIQESSEVLLAILILNGLLFLLSLIPPIFSWNKRKPDERKRVIFAFLACVTFYFWLLFLALNSIYCFGFLAHEGPCKHFNRTSNAFVNATESNRVIVTTQATLISDVLAEETLSQPDKNANSSPMMSKLLWNTDMSSTNESCSKNPISPHQADLRNLTIINVLIIVVLIVVLIANAREALNAKALNHKETLCKKEDVQKFLSSLVSKPPEVGHYVTCFHPAKSPDVKTNSTRKVVTFSAIENFGFQSWRDFSDVRLIEPSSTYPIIEIEIVLNFFPGDHFTAEKYKSFVMQLTKEHSGKDTKINIDDYFHIEDHREWTFFIGNQNYISPWWDNGLSRIFISCVFLFGWPFRMGYGGQIAKHQVEVKKAVFCENSSQDEGVSLSATPGSGSNNEENSAEKTGEAAIQNDEDNDNSKDNNDPEEIEDSNINKIGPTTATATTMTSPPPPMSHNHDKMGAMPLGAVAGAVAAKATASTSPPSQLRLEMGAGVRNNNNKQLVDALISNPPPSYAPHHQHQQQYHHHHHHHVQSSYPVNYSSSSSSSMNPPVRSQPLTSPRTHLRETTKDIVTAVTHHQDINGVNAVNTIALKDIDVQMSALSGYETYV